MAYKKQGPDYPIYPGRYIGQTVLRDGYKIPDRVMIPVKNKFSGKLEFMPMNIERTVVYNFTWYGEAKGWIKTEYRPPLTKDNPKKKAKPQQKSTVKPPPKKPVIIMRKKNGEQTRITR